MISLADAIEDFRFLTFKERFNFIQAPITLNINIFKENESTQISKSKILEVLLNFA